MLQVNQVFLKPRTQFHRQSSYVKINNNQMVKLSTCPTSFTTSTKKMGIGIGIDIASVERITQLIDRYDYATLSLLFTSNEINYCQSYQVAIKCVTFRLKSFVSLRLCAK
jgi:hypothetical protein